MKSLSNDSDFLRWFSESRSFLGYGEYFVGDKIFNISIISLIGLDKDNLKPFTKDAIKALEEVETFRDLKAGIRAYYQFQDILDLGGNEISVPLWNRHYCYYESLIYLKESVASWLDNNVLAGITLLRPFLELSVLHLYWYIRSSTKGFENFYLWLEGKKEKPPFRNQLDYVFDRLPGKDHLPKTRVREIKNILYSTYKGISAYLHSPRLDETIVNLNEGIQTSELSFFYYLANANLVLKQIVYLYVLAYPLTLFAVDRFKKWGFGGPMGIYFDRMNYIVLEAYLGEKNLQKIRKSLANMQDVVDKINWYDNQRDLTDPEIELGWQDFLESTKTRSDAQVTGERIAASKAYHRALLWFTNYFHSPRRYRSRDIE